MERFSGSLSRVLPDELRHHVAIRYFKKGELALNVTSGAVATRIKMLNESLIVQLATDLNFHGINRITVKVRPKPAEKKVQARRCVISEKNGQLLKAVAGETQDEGLKQALYRLAKRPCQTMSAGDSK